MLFDKPTSPPRGGNRFAATAAFAVLALAASTAQAAKPPAVPGPVGDAQGDFLGSYSGPRNPDLDVRSAAGTYDAKNFTLTTRMFGNIGQTEGSLYVWGVDRGKGTQFLDNLPGPHIGDGVTFDAFIVLFPNGTGSVNLIKDDLSIAPGTPLDAGAISIHGDTISVVIPEWELPTNGADFAHYGFNMWPRVIGLNNNAFVSDFAPDATNFTATGVPEPALWLTMIMGFGLIGATLRRGQGISALS